MLTKLALSAREANFGGKHAYKAWNGSGGDLGANIGWHDAPLTRDKSKKNKTKNKAGHDCENFLNRNGCAIYAV